MLIMGVLHTARHTAATVTADLEAVFGPLRAATAPAAFDFTDYYEPEMGPALTRWYCAFRALVSPGELAAIKLRTNALEQASMEHGRRTLNLDPGLLTPHSLILASCKNFSHRVYLRDGIYAEVTLLVRGGHLDELPWTYPDYRQATVRVFFDEQRATFLHERRH
jgi:hypothetical protein